MMSKLGALIRVRLRDRTFAFRVATTVAVLGCALAVALADRAHPARGAGTAMRNPFGQGMFGISTDGSMQDEAPRTRNRELAADQAVGAKWLRVSINWAEIQPKRRGALQWTRTDALVTAAEARGMSILGVMIYTPRWAGAIKSCRDPHCAPNAVYFAHFAKLAAAHYGALGVHAYEIWNEENAAPWWLPRPSPRGYTHLLALAYPAIKHSDSRAQVVSGGLSPAPTDGISYRPVDFLTALYQAGAKPYFDALGAHPSCWPAYPGQAFEWSSWYQTYGAKRSLRNAMLLHGDGRKLIWATEFGAATYGPKGTYVSLEEQAKMLYAGFKLWATYSWAGPLIVFESRDEYGLSHQRDRLGFQGLEFHNFAPKPGFAAYKRAVKTI